MQIETVKIKLGKRIKELRESKGLIRAEFARALNMNPQNVKRLEDGKNLTLRKLVEIANVFEITLSELLEGV